MIFHFPFFQRERERSTTFPDPNKCLVGGIGVGAVYNEKTAKVRRVFFGKTWVQNSWKKIRVFFPIFSRFEQVEKSSTFPDDIKCFGGGIGVGTVYNERTAKVRRVFLEKTWVQILLNKMRVIFHIFSRFVLVEKSTTFPDVIKCLVDGLGEGAVYNDKTAKVRRVFLEKHELKFYGAKKSHFSKGFNVYICRELRWKMETKR